MNFVLLPSDTPITKSKVLGPTLAGHPRKKYYVTIKMKLYKYLSHIIQKLTSACCRQVQFQSRQ